MTNWIALAIADRLLFAEGYEFGAVGSLKGSSGARTSRADADGNNIAGVRAPMVQAPLGTCCGWNLRSRGFGHGAMHEFSGSYIPLSESPEERRMTGDPRQSVFQRYPNAEAYVAAIMAAARRLVEQGLMLEEDVERAAAAADRDRLRHDIRLR